MLTIVKLVVCSSILIIFCVTLANPFRFKQKPYGHVVKVKHRGNGSFDKNSSLHTHVNNRPLLQQTLLPKKKQSPRIRIRIMKKRPSLIVERLPTNYAKCKDSRPGLINDNYYIQQRFVRIRRKKRKKGYILTKIKKKNDEKEKCQVDKCHSDCVCIHFARSGFCKRLNSMDTLEHCVCEYDEKAATTLAISPKDCTRIRIGFFPNLTRFSLDQSCNGLCRSDCRCNHGAKDGICATVAFKSYCRCILDD